MAQNEMLDLLEEAKRNRKRCIEELDRPGLSEDDIEWYMLRAWEFGKEKGVSEGKLLAQIEEVDKRLTELNKGKISTDFYV